MVAMRMDDSGCCEQRPKYLQHLSCEVWENTSSTQEVHADKYEAESVSRRLRNRMFT